MPKYLETELGHLVRWWCGPVVLKRHSFYFDPHNGTRPPFKIKPGLNQIKLDLNIIGPLICTCFSFLHEVMVAQEYKSGIARFLKKSSFQENLKIPPFRNSLVFWLFVRSCSLIFLGPDIFGQSLAASWYLEIAYVFRNSWWLN